MRRSGTYDVGELLSRRSQSPFKRCDVPGCDGVGEHPAPKSRDRLRDYYWFCLDHVRQYNSNWNYYAGMDEDQIEAHLRHDTTWRRPTWGFGTRRRYVRPGIKDEFGLFDGPDPEHTAERARHGPDAHDKPPPGTLSRRAALAELGLEDPATETEVKARYKALVKRHHPDANGGSRAAEERFKRINQAYTTLRDHYFA